MHKIDTTTALTPEDSVEPHQRTVAEKRKPACKFTEHGKLSVLDLRKVKCALKSFEQQVVDQDLAGVTLPAAIIGADRVRVPFSVSHQRRIILRRKDSGSRRWTGR